MGFFLLGVISAPMVVLAQGIKNSAQPLAVVADKSGVTESNLGNLTGGIIGVAVSLVGIIFFALMVYAGILWMTARGKEDQVEKSKQIIIASIIGLFIVVSAYAITVFVMSKF